MDDIKQGIYKITNIKNGKIYIGSTTDLDKRVYNHMSKLNNNSHYNIYLQKDWNKYGKNNFEFEIIEYVIEDNLIYREQYWLDLYRSYDRLIGYNIALRADRSNMTEETKEKLKVINIGKKHTEEMKQKIRNLHKEGRYKSKNEKQKGVKFSEETKQKMSTAHRGKVQSLGKRIKCSISKFGSKNPNYKLIPNNIVSNIVCLYHRNKNIADISKKIGLSRYKVKRFLIDNHIMEGKITWVTSKWL